ncbi:MAG TPA: hypothetical protein PLX89_15560 [Verrucomicrobiota bacterium]|nr:hypothetical protein [Verrucomicrobiales bacterium]HRI14411.1 hypothetical protein [Verrucomicrobiota bacterium]
MSERAQVSSIEAIESFRASLLTYLDAARPTLDEISGEVMRVRSWLDEDRLRFWEREVQRRNRLLREAQDALLSARMSHLREATDAEIVAVRKAKAALEEATERLRRVTKWCRDFDSRIAPLARQLDSLRNIFALEMPRAAASLTRTLDLLAEYAGQPPPSTNPIPDSSPSAAPPVPATLGGTL